LGIVATLDALMQVPTPSQQLSLDLIRSQRQSPAGTTISVRLFVQGYDSRKCARVLRATVLNFGKSPW
jgi:hypothetical protein